MIMNQGPDLCLLPQRPPVLPYGGSFVWWLLNREPGPTTLKYGELVQVLTAAKNDPGIIVRNALDRPGSSPGYLIVAASPAAGVSMEWDANDDGRLDRHTPFDGNTVWPVWVKLERHGSQFTGSYSGDGAHWIKLADADLPAAAEKLDAGIFAYRSSALFQNWQLH